MHRQQLKLLLTDNLLLLGHWGKEDMLAQRTSFNTLDNWGHKTPTQSKRKRNRKTMVKCSWPEIHTIHSVTSIYIYTYTHTHTSHNKLRASRKFYSTFSKYHRAMTAKQRKLQTHGHGVADCTCISL